MSETEEEFDEELVRLASADNFRDVCGVEAPYVTTEGRPLRRGVLYRSNELLLSDANAARLGRLGVTAVYDLRTGHEVEAHPDAELPGAEWHHLEVGGIPMDAVTTLHDRGDGERVMRQVYAAFVQEPAARAAFAQLFRRLAGHGGDNGAQLFHCTAGKDRTGWASALLLHLAGVADEVILEDYLLTNTFSSGTRDRYLPLVAEHLGPDKVGVYEAVMVADAGYLQTAYDAVAAAYGDREGYLRDGLGLDDEVLAGLCRLLLVA